MTLAELIDCHNITNPEVRGLFVAYLARRSHDIDEVTLRDLAADLCGKFWTRIRADKPGPGRFRAHSLGAARDKLKQMARQVSLGMPAVPSP